MSSSVAARPSSRIWVPLVSSSVFSQCPPVETSIVLAAGLIFFTVPSMEVSPGDGDTCISDRGSCACALQGPTITASNAAITARTRKLFRIPLPPFPSAPTEDSLPTPPAERANGVPPGARRRVSNAFHDRTPSLYDRRREAFTAVRGSPQGIREFNGRRTRDRRAWRRLQREN